LKGEDLQVRYKLISRVISLGASMNPLFAIGWELFRDFSFEDNYDWQDQLSHSLCFLSVYAIAPTLGASFAGLLLRRIESLPTKVRKYCSTPLIPLCQKTKEKVS
jgi:uncharacterized membrane protein YcfT